MAKRHAPSSASKTNTPIANSDSLKAFEQQVIAIAEELGRIAGTAQATADTWLAESGFPSQLARIRDRASNLLGRLQAAPTHNGGGDAKREIARERSRAKVSAPGKKHRRAPQRSRGVKHSEEKLTKALETRRRKSARPRQG